MMTLKVQQAKTFWQKLKGLIGTKPYPLLLKTRWGIHTFGMKYAIDVAILNNANRVAVLKENLKPNRIFLWNPRYENILELPEGFIKKNKLKIGQKVVLEDC